MRAVLPYLLAGAAVSAGVLLRLLLARVLGVELPFITLFPVVFIVAYFLGFGPTLLATALGIVAAVELFLGPRHGPGVAEPVAQLGALLFGLTGVGIGWLGQERLRARAAAASALEHASAEATRAEEETIRAEEEAARAEEETLRAEEVAQCSARESERVERVLASIGDAFFVVDHRWMVTYVNAAAAALVGGRPADLVGRLFWEAFPGSADGPLGEMYRRAMGGGRVTREQAYYTLLGRWLQVTAYPSTEGLSIVAQDVSDRVRAQEATERLAAIVASSVDGIIGKQLDGTIVSWNRGAEEIFGYSADEIVGRPIYTLVPPELHDSEREILARVRRGEPVAFSETERIRKDGQRITISLSVSPIRDESGRVVGVSSIKRDITSERRTRALLAAETARSRELTQVVDLAQALVRDLGGRISYWSTGAMRLYGWTAAEAVGRVAHELLHTEFPAPLPEINRLLLEHGQWEGQLVHVARDGRRLHVASQWVLRRDAEGRPEGVFEVNTDETSRRQMEERTRQSERLEVVGQLAGGVAHEANNQMTVVLGAADFLLRRPELAALARQDVEQIRAAAERTAAITGQLLAFSRRQVLRPRVLDLDETVRGLDLVLRRTLGEQSSLELRLGSAPGLVNADPGQLAQVLLNLVLNSRDAMPVGGRLTIETSCTELTEGYARQHPGVTIDAWPLRGPRGERHRTRDEPGDGGTGLRALLYDQADRKGNRARARHGVWDREAERGICLDL